MGFTVMVEAGYRDGFVASRLPTKEGGKAVFNFLGAMASYCIVPTDEEASLQSWHKWFEQFQTYFEQPLCEVFKPILDCMWGDGGGIGGEFLEDEYEWYLKRNVSAFHIMTEAEFRQFIEIGKKHWSSINKVMANVKLLVDTFKREPLQEEGLYVAKYMIPDFESLYETLVILDDFWYDNVRLNFS